MPLEASRLVSKCMRLRMPSRGNLRPGLLSRDSPKQVSSRAARIWATRSQSRNTQVINNQHSLKHRSPDMANRSRSSLRLLSISLVRALQ